MATARDRINRALRLIGVLASGETADASQLSDAIVTFNAMLDSWSADGLFIPNSPREEFALTPGTASYTMGSGATFSTARPVNILAAGLEVQGSTVYEVPMDIIKVDEYAAIENKATQSSIPTKLYVEWAFPNITLNLWPVPSEANRIVLYSEKPLTTISAATDSVSLAPGYDEAIDSNLAFRLAPEYGKVTPPEILAMAQISLASLQRKNYRPLYLECDDALVGRGSYNIYTGE